MSLTAEQRLQLDRQAGNLDSEATAACHAPFSTLAFQTSGEVLSCGRKPSTILGNIRSQRLTEIWRGSKLAELRASLRAYEFPTGCAWCGWCARTDELGVADLRKYRHLPVLEGDGVWPRRFEFNLSNACNLECIHCNGLLSSAIRKREHLAPLPRVYGDDFFADLAEFLPHLEEGIFLGGEPFLQTECFRIWDTLIERNLRPRCVITTNGTIYNPRVQRVLDALPFWLTVSLDGHAKHTVELIRMNSRYDDIWKNIDRFRRHADLPGNHLLLSFSVMRQNCAEFADFLQMAEMLDVEVTLNPVTDPASCSPMSMAPDELQPIVARLSELEPQLVPRLKRNAGAWYQGLGFLRAALDQSKKGGMVEALQRTRHEIDRTVQAETEAALQKAQAASLHGVTWNQTSCSWSDGEEAWSRRWAGSEAQWFFVIHPRIHVFLPTGTLLQIVLGYGRWTDYLKNYCQRLIGVDSRPTCIEACRRRFAALSAASFHVDNGTSLAMVPDASVDFAFTFDSLVDAERDVIGGYLAELVKKLTPAGVVFLHHSNLGAFCDPHTGELPATVQNRHWRATSVSAQWVADEGGRVGLPCVSQEIVTWGGDQLTDCFSVMTRTGSPWVRDNVVIENPDFMKEADHIARMSRPYVRRHLFPFGP